MKIDLRADLMSQDHTGYSWSLLEDAPDPSVVVPGALILAGEQVDPDDPVAVCRVVELEEINNHTVVRFEILPGDIEDYAVHTCRAATTSRRIRCTPGLRRCFRSRRVGTRCHRCCSRLRCRSCTSRRLRRRRHHTR